MSYHLFRNHGRDAQIEYFAGCAGSESLMRLIQKLNSGEREDLRALKPSKNRQDLEDWYWLNMVRWRWSSRFPQVLASPKDGSCAMQRPWAGPVSRAFGSMQVPMIE